MFILPDNPNNHQLVAIIGGAVGGSILLILGVLAPVFFCGLLWICKNRHTNSDYSGVHEKASPDNHVDEYNGIITANFTEVCPNRVVVVL